MERSNQRYLILIATGLMFQYFPIGYAEESVTRVRTYLRPFQSIEVSTTETGLIEEVNVKPGDRVEKGQVLIKLSSASIEAQLRQARAKTTMTGKRRAAEAERKLAKDRYSLMMSLKGRGSSNSAELNRGAASLQVAEGNLETVNEEIAFAFLEVARIQADLARRYLVSPIDGTVVDVTRDISETVSMRMENEAPYLVRVVDLSKLRAKAHVPYQSVSDLKKGDKLLVEYPLSGKTFEGTLEYISPVVDPSSGTVEVHVLFPNSSGEVPNGIPCDLLIPESK